MKAIRLPEGARFTCQSCGQCCQGWAVPVEPETVERLRAHNWGSDPFERSSDGGYQTRLVKGRCFFLDEGNRCRIHTELSYEAKPNVCRAFPLSVLTVGGEQYGRLSYWCPTVVANVGKPLEYQSRWVNDAAKHSDHRSTPLSLNETCTLGIGEFTRIHQALSGIFRERTFSIEDRLAAAAALIRRVEISSEGTAGSPAMIQAVIRAQSVGIAALAAETRGVGQSSAGRRLLSLYMLQDRKPGRVALLTRLLAVFLYNARITKLRCRAIGASASWRGVRAVNFAPSPAAEELLTRYFSSKLESRRYVAGEMSMVTGFQLLMVAYGLINVLARTNAAAGGKTTCDDGDVRLAIRAADFLAVEHSNLDRGTIHAKLMRSTLNDRNVGGDILACLAE